MFNSRDIIEEFISYVEQTLSNSTARKEFLAINRKFVKVEAKIQKLVDLHLDGLLDRKTYEDKFKVMKKERENILTELNRLELSASDEKKMKDRLRDLKKYFDMNKPLKKFDADVFNAIVDYIILGGINIIVVLIHI